MATWEEAMQHMIKCSRNTASLSLSDVAYRVKDGEIQRGSFVGNCQWFAAHPSNELKQSADWELLEPF